MGRQTGEVRSPAFAVWTAAKRAVRAGVVEPLRRRVDEWRFGACLGRLRAGDPLDRELVTSLRTTWGNDGFAADASYILRMAEEVERSSGPILECGTGVTTLIAAVLAERRGRSLWCLEQDADWLARIEGALARYRIGNVRVLHTPLRSYGDYVWYDIDACALPSSFDLVLCDGPFVHESWGVPFQQWRYGLMPVLSGRGVQFAKVLLDDVSEPRAAETFHRWAVEFQTHFHVMRAEDGDCALALHGGRMGQTKSSEGGGWLRKAVGLAVKPYAPD